MESDPRKRNRAPQNIKAKPTRGGLRDSRAVSERQISAQEEYFQDVARSLRDGAGKVRCPPKEFTSEQYRLVEELAAIGCTYDETALIMGMSVSTFKARVAHERKTDGELSRLDQAIQRGHARMKMSVRRAMFDKIASGNTAIIIFAAKTILGMVEQREIRHEVVSSVKELSDEELMKRVSATLIGTEIPSRKKESKTKKAIRDAAKGR